MDDSKREEALKALFLGIKINGVRVPTSRYAPPVSEEPEVVIDRWEILTVEGGRGMRGEVDGERRVTRLLKSFDLETTPVTTSSGRRHWLRGAQRGARRRAPDKAQKEGD